MTAGSRKQSISSATNARVSIQLGEVVVVVVVVVILTFSAIRYQRTSVRMQCLSQAILPKVRLELLEVICAGIALP